MSIYAELARPEADRLADFRSWFTKLGHERDLVFATIMVGALIAFELFNFGTTEFALTDLLGDLSLGFVSWATILALAFSAMDFAGLSWLFTPKKKVRVEVWYLVGAWFLAATMNAILTWWSVSLALLNHPALGNEVITRESLLSGAPILVAALVWLLRVLLIGTFTLAGHRRLSRSRSAVQSGRPFSARNSGKRAKRTLVAQPISQR
ncbi:MAG: hypothetical protein ACC647_00980 [Anaerolineales bacterium]